MTKKIFASIILVFSFILAGCNNTLTTPEKPKACSLKTVLKISLADNSRTIMPQVSPDEFNKFILRGVCSEQNYNFGIWNSFDELTQATIEVDNGTWAFMLIAMKDEESFMGIVRNVNIEEGDSEKQLSFTLTHCTVNLNDLSYELDAPFNLNEGKGSAAVSFEYDDKDAVKTAEVSFYTSDENPVQNFTSLPLDITVQNEKGLAAININDIPSGIYLARFKFYADEEKQCVVQDFIEYVYIAKDFVSKKSFKIDSFYTVFNIAYELNGFNWKEGFTPVTKGVKKNPEKIVSGENLNLGNHEFLGWYTDSNYENPAPETIKNDTTLYGKFKIHYPVELYVRDSEEEDFVLDKTLEAAGILGTRTSPSNISNLDEAYSYTIQDALITKDTGVIKLFATLKKRIVTMYIEIVTEDDWKTDETTEIELRGTDVVTKEFLESLNIYPGYEIINWYSNENSVGATFVRPPVASIYEDMKKYFGSLYYYTSDGKISFIELRFLLYQFPGNQNLKGVCLDLTEQTDVETIAQELFMDTPGVKELVLPKTLKEMKKGCLMFCDLQSLTIPASVTYIQPSLFTCYSSSYEYGTVGTFIFEDPDNWTVKASSDSEPVALSREDLSDPETATLYLKSTYKNYEWLHKTK